MSTLIPEITISEFRKLKALELKQLKSCEVTSDGETLFLAIIPPVSGGVSITDYIKTQAEYLAVKANTAGGKELSEILEEVKV